VLRLIVGFGCAGIFVTTESWLSAKAPPSERGRIFSIYMVGTFLALGLGQLLIARTDIKANGAFDGIIALFAIALVIVTAARAEAPRIIAGVALRYGVLARAAPIAGGGCALSGLVGGCFYALVPAWMQSQGTRKEIIALFMLVAVLGASPTLCRLGGYPIASIVGL
jgi:MFS family permease